MTADNTSLGKLALSSMRLNRGVLILVGVAVVLVGTCAWALQRLLEVEALKVESHFVIILNVDRVLSPQEITMLASMSSNGNGTEEE